MTLRDAAVVLVWLVLLATGLILLVWVASWLLKPAPPPEPPASYGDEDFPPRVAGGDVEVVEPWALRERLSDEMVIEACKKHEGSFVTYYPDGVRLFRPCRECAAAPRAR